MALTDTHPAMAKFQLKMLQEVSFQQRLKMALDLTQTTRALSWQGLCERYPDESPRARVERFVFLLYKDRALSRNVAERYMADCGNTPHPHETIRSR